MKNIYISLVSLLCHTDLFHPSISAQTFIQDPLSDGVVVFEAVEHAAQVPTATHAWEPVTLPTGESALQALPNDGTKLNADFLTTSPRLDFEVAFDRAGTHYVVIRGYGESYTDDSFHAGINGQFVSTADRMRVDRNSLDWSNETADGVVASLEVPSPGTHTINIWMREDGFFLQRIMLTTHPNFVPHGDGPPLSPRVGENHSSTEADLFQPRLYHTQSTGGMISARIQPGVAIESYRVLESAGLNQAMSPVSSASIEGFDVLIDPAGKSQAFYALEAVKVDPLDELTGLLLNRLAYGPTPDLLEHVLTGPTPIGPLAWMNEQLAPETLAESADARPDIQALLDRIYSQTAEVEDLQACHSLRAIHADRQLMEVLLQFINNHFVTYIWKARDYLDDELEMTRDAAESMATVLELWEMDQWQKILLDPNATFYDLLKVSIESASMIIYLDTVENEQSEPNENYARELLELFTMGVDNGYHQRDIEEMAKVWTGWRIALAHPADTNVPPLVYAPTTMIGENSTSWLWRKGTSEPAADWRELDFTPGTNWMTGQTSIGYGDDDDLTVTDDMRYKYTTLYFRHLFDIVDPATVGAMTLRIFMDDGYAAYLNGELLDTYNLNDNTIQNLSHQSTADTAESNGSWTTITINDPAAWLQAGANVLAVHGLNVSLSSSDFSFDVELIAGPQAEYRVNFDPSQHWTSNKTVFAGYTVDPRFGPPYAGQSYELDLPERSGMAGMQAGYDTIAHLANLPYTMEFMSVKLCRLFVHDGFKHGYYFNVSQQSEEGELIRACMAAWDTPGPDGRKGNLRSVLTTIFDSDLFRSQYASQHKVKTPLEFSASALRALKSDLGGRESAETDGFDLLKAMDRAGMEPFERQEPNGWAEEGGKWIDTGTIVERLRFIQNFMMAANEPMKAYDYGSSGVNNLCDPVALLQSKLPAADLNKADIVSDFLISLIFPGAGAATLGQERQACIELLNTNEAANPNSSPFTNLTVGGAPYENRVRSAAALLLCSPRFHEQ